MTIAWIFCKKLEPDNLPWHGSGCLNLSFNLASHLASSAFIWPQSQISWSKELQERLHEKLFMRKIPAELHGEISNRKEALHCRVESIYKTRGVHYFWSKKKLIENHVLTWVFYFRSKSQISYSHEFFIFDRISIEHPVFLWVFLFSIKNKIWSEII